MKCFLKHIFICICLFSILFLGSLYIGGPLSFRNFAALLLVIISLLFSENIIQFDKIEKGYFIFLIILLICNAINGRLLETSFLKDFLSKHVLCVILIISLPRLINDKRSLKVTLLFIFSLFVFNSIISILQFYNNPIGWRIGLAICPTADELVESADYYLSTEETTLGHSIVMGITGFVVANGYFTASFFPVVIYCFSMTKLNNAISYILSICTLLLGSFTLYCIQQRIAFFLLAAIGFIIIIRSRKSIILLLLFVLLLLLFNYTLPVINWGRLTDISSGDSRIHFFQTLSDYSSSPYFLFGGDLSEESLFTIGHNTFLDAIRRGGLFSFIAYCILMFYIIKYLISIFISGFKKDNNISFGLCLCCLTFIVYSLTHSTGIQSGAIIFWICYELMKCAIKNEEDIIVYR